jgi:hypothetical protein
MSRRPRIFGNVPHQLLRAPRAPRPQAHFRLEGWVTVSVRRHGEERLRRRFRNLITDAGIDAIATGGLLAQFEYAAAGTGNTAPAIGQTALVAQVGARTNDDGTLPDDYDWTSEYVSVTRQRVFVEGSVEGEIAEVGWFSGATGANMWSRVLILDETDTPTTVEMEADDELVVLYELRLYVTSTDVEGTVAIAGVPYDFTVRPCNYEAGLLWTEALFAALGVGTPTPPSASEEGPLVAIDADPPAGTIADGIATAPYSSGSARRGYRATWNMATANFAGGIEMITFPLSDDPAPHYQVLFSPPIPKTADQKLKLLFAVTFGRR